MTLQQIYYILTIAENRSMNKAAEKLYIAQPTLTSVVKDVEQEIGIPIFLRTHRGVTVTSEGEKFIASVRRLYQQYEEIRNQYSETGTFRRKFSVSMQHYSFAVKAFIETAKQYDANEFDLIIRETRTLNVIRDVGNMKSEIGILYMSEQNRRVISRLMKEQELEFHTLIKCPACVYLAKSHPLAQEKELSLYQLEAYPCLSFEQGSDAEVFLAEELLTEHVFQKTIKASDRATMMNLLEGLDGYTLCSSVFNEHLSSGKFLVIPLKPEENMPDLLMEIGYITKKNAALSSMGQQYIREIIKSLKEN
ncbi:MAG: LysR family transcriptional regulator [Oscillospiraceae bacterium]|nr:LysR family transcriptional regulator [Oscillospiraceae bacterium]